MVFIPALLLASSVALSSFAPGANAAAIPLPLQQRAQRPMLRDQSSKMLRRDPDLKWSPDYDEDHSQHWNYHHGLVNTDGHGHGPPRPHRERRSTPNRYEPTYFDDDLIDVEVDLAKRHSHDHKPAVSRKQVSNKVAQHYSLPDLVDVDVHLKKRHSDNWEWEHDRHYHHGDDNIHVHEHDHKKREEIEPRDEVHLHEHGHHHHGYWHHGEWHHYKRSDVEARDHYHEHDDEHDHHHHHVRSDHVTGEHHRDSKANDEHKKPHGKSGSGKTKGKKFFGKKGGDMKKKKKNQAGKADAAKVAVNADLPKVDKLARRGLPPMGVPGFVEVATQFLNSTLSRSIAGLAYTAAPNATDDSTNSFILGTSVSQSTQFYITPSPDATGDLTIVNIRLPILNSRELSTKDYCATFDLAPPSPLSLMPCGDLDGFSQNFAYNETTSELQPLYTLTSAPAPMALVEDAPTTPNPKSFSAANSTTLSNSTSAPTDGSADDEDAQSISLFFVPASTYYQSPTTVPQLFTAASLDDANPDASIPPVDDTSSTPDGTQSCSSTSASSASVASSATMASSATVASVTPMSVATPSPSSASASVSPWMPTPSPSPASASASPDGGDDTLSTSTVTLSMATPMASSASRLRYRRS